MAVLLMEGFDFVSLGLKGWLTTTANDSNFASAGGTLVSPRFGTGSSLKISVLKNTNFLGSYIYYKVLPSSSTTIIAGVAIYKDSFSLLGTTTLEFRTLGGSSVAALRLDGNSIPYIVDGSGSTIASASTSAIHYTGTWQYYEMKIVVNGASGSCQLKRNGQTIISSTTGNFGSTAIQTIALWGNGNSTSVTYYYTYDDLYAINLSGSAPRNDFLGDCRIETLRPNGAGTTTQWTASTGSNYTTVDESSPNDDTDYVSTSTLNNIDTYAFDNLALTGGTIYSLQTNLYAKKDDAGTRIIAPVIRQSGTNYVGTDQALSTSYQYYSQIYEQDPTGTDWSISNINADEFGVKLTG